MRPKPNDEKPTHYCARLQSRLLTYLDGDMTDQERQLVQAHLNVCIMCQRELQACRSAEQMLMQAQQALSPAGDLSAGFYARMAAEDRSNRNKFGRKINWRLAIPALAACGLFIGFLEGRFLVPGSPMNDAAPSGDKVAVAPSSRNSIANRTPDEDVLMRNDPYLLYTPPTKEKSVHSLRPVYKPVSNIAALKMNGSGNLFGFRTLARAKGRDSANVKNSFTTFNHLKINKLKSLFDGASRLDEAAATNLGKSMTYALAFAYPGSAKLQPPKGQTALAYTPQRHDMDKDAVNLTAKLNVSGVSLLKEESFARYHYDSKAIVNRSTALGVPDLDVPSKFGRISSALVTSTEDDGVNFQVRDTRRGFTSEMRLASRVELHDGRQVLSIHLEDKDDALPGTNDKNADNTKADNK